MSQLQTWQLRLLASIGNKEETITECAHLIAAGFDHPGVKLLQQWLAEDAQVDVYKKLPQCISLFMYSCSLAQVLQGKTPGSHLLPYGGDLYAFGGLPRDCQNKSIYKENFKPADEKAILVKLDTKSSQWQAVGSSEAAGYAWTYAQHRNTGAVSACSSLATMPCAKQALKGLRSKYGFMPPKHFPS